MRILLTIVLGVCVAGCTANESNESTASKPTPKTDQSKTVAEVETQAKEMTAEDLRAVVATYEAEIEKMADEAGAKISDMTKAATESAEAGLENASAKLDDMMGSAKEAGSDAMSELDAMRKKLAAYAAELSSRE